MLTHRGRRILFALISEYIATGEPVASAALVRARGIELSSASIRAVFAELENQGYLLKPHSSAGRVPTEKGLRAFVDALLGTTDLPEELRAEIELRFENVRPGLDAALRHTGRVLAEVTSSAAVVLSAPGLAWVLRELRFISVRSNEVLAVIVGKNGAVQNRAIRLDEPMTPAELERANNMLREMLEGRTLPQIRQFLEEQLETERARMNPALHAALTLGERALADAEHDPDVLVEGHAQLIGRPEFSDIDRARHALRTLEDKERLIRLLDRTLATPGLQVVIGSEAETIGAGDLSVVATQFGAGSGTLGVIGSTRMDYPSVVPVVRYTAAVLSRILREQEAEGKPV